MENDNLSQGQKSLRINWATNDNHETTLSPGAEIYAKLIGHNNIELSDKSNNSQKFSLTFGLFRGEFRNIAICKLKLRLVNAIKYKYYLRRLCKLALYIINIFVNFANATKAK